MEERHSLLQLYPHYWGFTPEQDFYSQQQIKFSSSLFTSPRGLTLFTRSWLPFSPPRAAIFMVHGYGNDISWTFQGTAIFLAQMGFNSPASLSTSKATANLRASRPSSPASISSSPTNWWNQSNTGFTGFSRF